MADQTIHMLNAASGQMVPLRATDNGDGTYTLAVSGGTTGGAKAFSTLTVGGIAAQIVAANPNRSSVLITNTSNQTVYLGNASDVTTATGFPLPAGATLVDDTSKDAWYGVVASGSAEVRVMEVA